MSHNASYANSSITTSNYTTFFSLGKYTTIDNIDLRNKKYSDIFTEVSMKSKLDGSDTCSGKDCIVAVKCNTSQGWYPYNGRVGVTSSGSKKSVTSTRKYAYTTDAYGNDVFNSTPKAQTCYHENYTYYCQNGVDCKGWKVCESSTGTSCVDFKYYIWGPDFDNWGDFNHWEARANHFAGQNSKEVWPIVCVKEDGSNGITYHYQGSLFFDFGSKYAYDSDKDGYNQAVYNCMYGYSACYYYVVSDNIYENGQYYYNVFEPYIDWDNIEDIDDPDEVSANTYDPEFWGSSYGRPAGKTADQLCQEMIESRAVGCESAGYKPWDYKLCQNSDWVCTPDNLFARGSHCYSTKRRKTCEEYNDPYYSEQYSSTNSCPSGYYLDGTVKFNDMSCYRCVKSGS